MARLNKPALDPAEVPVQSGSNYPEPYRAAVAGRSRRRLGDALGLRNFGVNLTTLPPGAASALRHWHARQDEFVYVVEGELVLVTNAGEQRLGPGDCAGFPAGVADGHQLVNRGDRPATYLEVGDRTSGDVVSYSDVDLHAVAAQTWRFTRKDGSDY
jgi:uncharacterized cupin superfamily protein